MKDYHKICEICEILDSYCLDSEFNLQAEHDELYFNFNVSKDELSQPQLDRLDDLGVRWHNDQWSKDVSC